MWVWRAWHRLSLDRPVYGGGMGAMIQGRIPWQLVMAYADRHNHDAVFLDQAVVQMDSAFLAWSAERMKQAANG